MRGRIRIAMVCAGALLTTAAGARAQTTFRETGSVTIGGYLVWVRGTNTSAVELFVGRGYRDAFARAHEMDAAKLQQWIDSVRAIAPRTADDSSAVDVHARGSTIGADVSMVRRVGGPHSGLRLLVSGEDPIEMAEPTARDFIAMLDSAAHVTRELTVLPPSILASTPAPGTVPAQAPALAEAMGPSTGEAPPELVLPAPNAPVVLLASRVDIMPLPMPPVVAAAPALEPPPASAPAPAPAPTLLAAPVPAPVPAPLSPPAAAPVPAPVPAPPPPAPDSAVAPHVDVPVDAPADKLIHTPLGPFTIPGALLGDRDKAAQYCYTQLGLKYDPDLKGEITVRLSLGTDGAVQDAVVTKRNWQGISAGEVESCVRALAHDWSFAPTDPTVVAGAKLLTFSFAPDARPLTLAP